MLWVEGVLDGIVDSGASRAAWRQACIELLEVGHKDDTIAGGSRAYLRAVK